MSDAELRVTELELRFMEQQATLQTLSDVVYAQMRALDALTEQVELLRKKLAEPGLVDAADKERPPHY
jgi:SlyX protein